jgi:peptidoglycan/LPS O-acetylase OafA/YrhL
VPPAAPARPVPFGFVLCGFGSLCVCLAALVALVLMELEADFSDWRVPAGRGAAALLAMLAAVMTEALWRLRPWVWRASLALAMAYAATVIVGFSTYHPPKVGEALFVLMASAVVAAPPLVYIRRRAKAMWPKQPPPHSTAPIAMPRPSPPMHPAPRPGSRP